MSVHTFLPTPERASVISTHGRPLTVTLPAGLSPTKKLQHSLLFFRPSFVVIL